MSEWYEFDKSAGQSQTLPPERKDVVVMLKPFRAGLPAMLMVGYLRYAAGDKDSPQFILPGVPEYATVIAWRDCLREQVIGEMPTLDFIRSQPNCNALLGNPL